MNVQWNKGRLHWIKVGNTSISAEVLLASWSAIVHVGVPVPAKQFQKPELAVEEQSHLPRLPRAWQATKVFVAVVRRTAHVNRRILRFSTFEELKSSFLLEQLVARFHQLCAMKYKI